MVNSTDLLYNDAKCIDHFSQTENRNSRTSNVSAILSVSREHYQSNTDAITRAYPHLRLTSAISCVSRQSEEDLLLGRGAEENFLHNLMRSHKQHRHTTGPLATPLWIIFSSSQMHSSLSLIVSATEELKFILGCESDLYCIAELSPSLIPPQRQR